MFGNLSAVVAGIDLFGVSIDMRWFTVIMVSNNLLVIHLEWIATGQIVSLPRVVVVSPIFSINRCEILLIDVHGSITALTECFFLPWSTSTTAVGKRLVVWGLVSVSRLTA